jgi:tetratricopeptide (TPR) repeat protein
LFSEKKYEESLPFYRAAVALAPDFLNLQSQLGRSLYWLDDYEGAIVPLQIAQEIDHDSSSRRVFQLGFCCFETRRWADTIKYVDLYCDLDEYDDAPKVTMLSMKALAHLALGQARVAKSLCQGVERIEEALDTLCYYAGELREKMQEA